MIIQPCEGGQVITVSNYKILVSPFQSGAVKITIFCDGEKKKSFGIDMRGDKFVIIDL